MPQITMACKSWCIFGNQLKKVKFYVWTDLLHKDFMFNLILKPKIKLDNSDQQNQIKIRVTLSTWATFAVVLTNECVQVCLKGKENPNK